MSVSLTIRWVFGYRLPKRHTLDCIDYGECTLDPIECMGSGGGYVLFANASEIRHLNDRDGIEYDKPLWSFDQLPPTEEFVQELDRFFEAEGITRPTEPPRWFLHTDLG